MKEVDRLLDRQDGVITRGQALSCGLTTVDVKRLVRRREWVAVHPGVYVNHTGPRSWRQRAWAAVLACDGALDGWSAIRAHEGPGRRGSRDDALIEVVVPHGRRPASLAGVRIRQLRPFDAAVQHHLAPPRVRYDDAILRLADRARRDLDRVAILADACGGRRTTAERLLARLCAIPRLTHRTFVEAVVADIATGTCSVLEHAYLTKVERPHGLPRSERQVEARDDRGRRMYRDVVHSGRRPPWQQNVELDGRLGHDSTSDRDRDFERDLDAALTNADTVRLSYGQVIDRACATAAKLGQLFQLRGWTGAPVRCPSCGPDERMRSGDVG